MATTLVNRYFNDLDYERAEAEWTSLAVGETGATADMAQWVRQSVQVTGTFGVAGTVLIEGSNDGVNFFTLNDQAGAALSFTVAGLRSIREYTAKIRARTTTGDGTTALKVVIEGLRNE